MTATITNRILEGIHEDDLSMIAIAANRESNMTGARYSDALRAQRRIYEQIGRAAFARLHDESTRVARQMGY